MASRCRSCNAPIEWRENANGNWEPLNLNGVSHFETCPEAKNWRTKHNMKQSDHVGHLETKDSKQTRLKDGI